MIYNKWHGSLSSMEQTNGTLMMIVEIIEAYLVVLNGKVANRTDPIRPANWPMQTKNPKLVHRRFEV
jgi:hypothetical protein